MESLDKVWTRLLELNPVWKVALTYRSSVQEGVVMTGLAETQGGVIKVVIDYEEEQSSQIVQRSKVVVEFLQGAEIKKAKVGLKEGEQDLDKGKLDLKNLTKKTVVHKSEFRVDMNFRSGFLGLGKGFFPCCDVPKEHETIRQYALRAKAQKKIEEAQAAVRSEAVRSGEADQAGQDASRSFFGS